MKFRFSFVKKMIYFLFVNNRFNKVTHIIVNTYHIYHISFLLNRFSVLRLLHTRRLYFAKVSVQIILVL